MEINEHVLVTGASSKLGDLISKILAKKNYSLLLHYYKSKKKTINQAKNLKEKFKNQNFYPLYLDLSKNHSLEFMSEIIFSETKNLSSNFSSPLSISSKAIILVIIFVIDAG